MVYFNFRKIENLGIRLGGFSFPLYLRFKLDKETRIKVKLILD